MMDIESVLDIIVQARDHCYEARLYTATETYIAKVTRTKALLSLHKMTAYGEDLEVSWTDDTLAPVLRREGTMVANATIDLDALTKMQLVDNAVHGCDVLKEVTA